uniref:RxLR effector candidate protein n=1 Tax=Hyaloperonospora arabidopsidis (strain Emoy2) TaxID=559515 RepID=M4BJ87_HYAAE
MKTLLLLVQLNLQRFLLSAQAVMHRVHGRYNEPEIIYPVESRSDTELGVQSPRTGP